MATYQWDDEDFCQRVRQCAEDIGKPLDEVCREAQVARDFVTRKPPPRGRNTEAILRLAGALGVPPEHLLIGPIRSRTDVGFV